MNYTVSKNSGGPRTPTINVGNAVSTTPFTVNQAAGYTCTFTLSPSSVEVTSTGISTFFEINASFSFCKWTAVSNNPSALLVAGPNSGTGSGVVYYVVAQNTTTSSRILTITAGCQTFTVNQDGTLTASNPAPTITSLSPSSAVAGSGGFTLTVNGTNFVSGATVNFNGTARTTTFVSSTQVTAAILASDVATAGTAPVTVTNPTPGGGTSNSLTFTITGTSNPTPTLASLSPNSVVAGSGAFTLTVNGTNFIRNSVVNFNGAARTTTYVSSTQLTAAILATDVATTGTAPVTVTNPTPGGGTSNSLTFTITAAPNPVPTLTSLSPSLATAGSGAFTLTVNGTNFITTSVVNFNGNSRATTYVSATQLTAAILASDVASAGSAPVTVTNPSPGGGTSNSATFTINAAAPVAGLSPTTLGFGNQTINTTSAPQTVVLSNTGNAPLTITSITITGTNASSFAQTNKCGGSVAAGSSCSISVMFAPSATGAAAAMLSVADNAAGTPQTASLTGTGTAVATPTAVLAPSVLAFSNQTVNTTSAAQTLTLSNSGTAALTITSITITGTNANSFAQTNNCGASVAAGLSCTISVTFTPTGTGALSAA